MLIRETLSTARFHSPLSTMFLTFSFGLWLDLVLLNINWQVWQSDLHWGECWWGDQLGVRGGGGGRGGGGRLGVRGGRGRTRGAKARGIGETFSFHHWFLEKPFPLFCFSLFVTKTCRFKIEVETPKRKLWLVLVQTQGPYCSKSVYWPVSSNMSTISRPLEDIGHITCT